MSTAKHVGVPDACPLCRLPLWAAGPDGRRDEIVWRHALAQFLDQSGVDVTGLTRADLVPLVKSWGRVNTVATLERRLLATDVEAAEPGRAPTNRLFAALILAILVCLSVISAGVWSFLS